VDVYAVREITTRVVVVIAGEMRITSSIRIAVAIMIAT